MFSCSERLVFRVDMKYWSLHTESFFSIIFPITIYPPIFSSTSPRPHIPSSSHPPPPLQLPVFQPTPMITIGRVN